VPTVDASNAVKVQSGTGANQISLSNGLVALQADQAVNVTKVGGTTQTARDLGAALPAAVPGASGGLLINGSNSGAITLGSGVTISNSAGTALTLTSSGGNGHGIQANGNGTGSGVNLNGGATGAGLRLVGGATSGPGLYALAQGGGSGIRCEGVGANNGLHVIGGATGHGLLATGGSDGDGIRANGGATDRAGIYANGGGNGHGFVFARGATGGGDDLYCVNADATIPTVTTVTGLAAGSITAAAIATGAIDADALDADAVDEILDEVIEGSITLRQAVRVLLAAAAGKLAGAGTTGITIRDQADTKNRISATVDAAGNRSAVTLDVS
jgi:hypothetical protein